MLLRHNVFLTEQNDLLKRLRTQRPRLRAMKSKHNRLPIKQVIHALDQVLLVSICHVVLWRMLLKLLIGILIPCDRPKRLPKLQHQSTSLSRTTPRRTHSVNRRSIDRLRTCCLHLRSKWEHRPKRGDARAYANRRDERQCIRNAHSRCHAEEQSSNPEDYRAKSSRSQSLHRRLLPRRRYLPGSPGRKQERRAYGQPES